MTTSTSTAVISHASTTTFRAWGLELSNMLTAIGFIKSADTGQINWATATKPAVGVSAGYEIRYMNDSLHATAPIYVKLEYGTDSTGAAVPAMWITIGTGSNLAGTLTGILVVREAFGGNGTLLDSTVLTKVSYACMAHGCVWFTFKTAVRGQWPAFMMSIERTKSDAGVPTGDGFVYHKGPLGYAGYSSSSEVYIFAGGLSYSNGGTGYFGGAQGYCFMPYGLGGLSTIVAGVPGDFQFARHYHPNPQIRPLMCIVSSSPADAISRGTTVTLTVLGTTPRTYISVGTAFSYYDVFMMIWE